MCNCVTRSKSCALCILLGEQAAQALPRTALTTWLRCWSWPRCHWFHHKVRVGHYDVQKKTTTSFKNDRNYHVVRSDIGPAREATDVSDDRHAPPPGLNFLDKRFLSTFRLFLLQLLRRLSRRRTMTPAILTSTTPTMTSSPAMEAHCSPRKMFTKKTMRRQMPSTRPSTTGWTRRGSNTASNALQQRSRNIARSGQRFNNSSPT